MTIGDIIEAIRGLFGGATGKVRSLRTRVDGVKEKIKGMEEGQDAMLKRVGALDGQINELKVKLGAEANEHVQVLLMDRIDGLEKEFNRLHELADLKGLNVDAARVLRSKLEQMLEMAENGSGGAELEGILDEVEGMNEDMAGVRELVKRLDVTAVNPNARTREATTAAPKTVGASSEDIAARRARMLGQKPPAKTAATEAAPAAAPAATPVAAPASVPTEAPAAPAAGVVVAG